MPELLLPHFHGVAQVGQHGCNAVAESVKPETDALVRDPERIHGGVKLIFNDLVA